MFSFNEVGFALNTLTPIEFNLLIAPAPMPRTRTTSISAPPIAFIG
nr:hypothetical protein [Clostridium baratii]